MKDGGPAFPVIDTDEHRQPYYAHLGMSLRDYFACQAMARVRPHYTGFVGAEAIENAVRVARESYTLADAMLAEREKTKETA